MFILTVLVVVNVVLGCCLIGLILLQHGRGADAGAAFGSGASSTVFGARGSASFLTKSTAVLAAAFLANSLLLTYMTGQALREKTIMEQGAPPAVSTPVEQGETPSPPPGEVVGPEETAPPANFDVPTVPDE
ncbi:MAG: preprotein translocase subunit SecG [Gammaproteobacteria bacterium]|nr:preprotein translocase subunit SecG [Gammaproteobacteria bacterium]